MQGCPASALPLPSVNKNRAGAGRGIQCQSGTADGVPWLVCLPTDLHSASFTLLHSTAGIVSMVSAFVDPMTIPGNNHTR